MQHDLKRDDIDFDALTAEISAAVGKPVAVVGRLPGQTDDEGAPLPGVLAVLDQDGEEVAVSSATVQKVLTAHVGLPAPVPPLTDVEITAVRALLAANAL